MLPFGIIACTFFSDNLSRNSCIAVYISLLCRGIWRSLKGWGEEKKKREGDDGKGKNLYWAEREFFEFVEVCWIRFFKWESFIGFCNWCYPISMILACLFTVALRISWKKLCWKGSMAAEMPKWDATLCITLRLNLSKLSRKFVWALGTTTNCRISFTDLFLGISHKFYDRFTVTLLWYYHRAWVTCGGRTKS